MEKMTKKDKFARAIEVIEGTGVEDAEMLVDFLNREIELVSKKRTSMTKTQKENEGLVEVIYEAIANAESKMTIGEIYDAVKDNEKITSTQKVSALVKKLVDSKRVVRTEDKRKAYFEVA